MPLKPYGTSVRTLFSPQWVAALHGVPELGMVAAVQFYDPSTTTAVYDPETNTYVSIPDVLWAGQARVQPLRSAQSINNNATDTTTQAVLVSIPIGAGLTFDLRPKHRGRVTASPLNPLLTGFMYVVQEVMDSSNPIERTFIFTVNQEVVQ